MGTINQGITGGFSGKVGTVIGGSWNGVDYMRGIPAHMDNPKTVAQQNQRAKMTTIVRFLRPMTEFLRIGFKKQAVKMSAFNAATSWNLAHALNGAYPEFEIDYSQVMVSQGKLPGAQSPQVSYAGNGRLTFIWEDNSMDKGALPDDRVLLLVVDPEIGQVETIMGGNLRMDGSQEIILPPHFSGMEVQCYIAFRNAKQTEISDSRWAGSVVV